MAFGMLNDLISELCEYLGILPLRPDSRGVYEIVFDDGLNVEILSLSGSQVLVRADIAELPDDRDEWKDCIQQHLQNNMLLLRDQSNTLSLDQETGTIWLYRMARTNQPNFHEFCELVSAFVVTLEWWKKRADSSTATTSAMDLMPHNIIRP